MEKIEYWVVNNAECFYCNTGFAFVEEDIDYLDRNKDVEVIECPHCKQKMIIEEAP